MKQHVTLIASSVAFFSKEDEQHFFELLNRIRCVLKVKGIGKDIQIIIRSNEIFDEELLNLVALFRRYSIAIEQLEVFVRDENKKLFEAYKHALIVNVYPQQ